MENTKWLDANQVLRLMSISDVLDKYGKLELKKDDVLVHVDCLEQGKISGKEGKYKMESCTVIENKIITKKDWGVPAKLTESPNWNINLPRYLFIWVGRISFNAVEHRAEIKAMKLIDKQYKDNNQ